MIKQIKRKYSAFGAAVALGVMLGSESADAANNFGSIAKNITTGISELPGLITALSYLFGVLLAVLGIMKIKDHVENPTQTPLKEGAIRLAAGGALFSVPIVTEAMSETVGSGTAAKTATLKSVQFGTN